MNWNGKESNKQKHQFKSYYCASCKQRKPCQLLTGWDSDWKSYCCPCYYQSQQERTREYNHFEKILSSKQREKKEKFQQLQLLKNYQGCKKCGSQEVDAYRLYENNRLVCQPCLMRKEGRSSSPISFLEQEKWYKRHWKIELVEWLENYRCLPVNKNCVEKWRLDNKHLGKCDCLEVEAKESYLLFSNSLQKNKEQLEKECQCEVSNKTRTPYYDSANYGYTYCEKCEKEVRGAGKMGVIRNRNDPRFWGLDVEEKVLCLECLGGFWERMPVSKRYVFNKYVRRGYE